MGHNPQGIFSESITSVKEVTYDANNTTESKLLFRVTGAILCEGIWNEITTTIGSNHTAAFYRLNDQTAQVDITANSATVSNFGVGSLLYKKDFAGGALQASSSAAGRVVEAFTIDSVIFESFVVVAKLGANTDIEYRYSTTNTPTTGAARHFLRWRPLSLAGSVTVL